MISLPNVVAVPELGLGLCLGSEARHRRDAERRRFSGLSFDDGGVGRRHSSGLCLACESPPHRLRCRENAERSRGCGFLVDNAERQKRCFSEGSSSRIRRRRRRRRSRRYGNGGSIATISCCITNDSSISAFDSVPNRRNGDAESSPEASAMPMEVKDSQNPLQFGPVSSGMQGLSNPGFLSDSLRFLFAAGGTGGHVFPAIAIADALKAFSPSPPVSSPFTSDIRFVGTKHRIESSVVPRSGYRFHTISAVSLRRPIFLSIQNLLLPFRLLISLYQALQILLRLRPHAVIGTGGYVSFSVCIAAWLIGIPFVIQEQNAYPGVANRILSIFATAIFVAFSASITYFPHKKCIVSGNPVRASLRDPMSKTASLDYFFPNWRYTFDESRRSEVGLHELVEIVLIQGGSLGAKSINEAVGTFIKEMLEKHPQRFFIWQTGSKHFRALKEKIDGDHQRLYISEFIDDMSLAYSAADLVVASAGAITCSELLVVGKPSVLIPLKYVVDDHQRKNAAVLAQAGACRVVYDDKSTPRQLEIAIDELLSNKQVLLQMRENALKIATMEASGLIAKEVFSIAERHAFSVNKNRDKKDRICWIR